MKFHQSRMASPIGELVLVTDTHQHLRLLQFADRGPQLQRALSTLASKPMVQQHPPSLTARALADYFDGEVAALERISVSWSGNDFAASVWNALRKVPAGRTTTYGKLARDLGHQDPRKAIDVGAANAANLIAIVVPCHRVVGSNGELKGYAWGPHRKRWLLEHEGALNAPTELGAVEQRLPGF
jgi:methylated-DNA-[protein]-cysteine S-methyltransferase